MPDDPTVTRRTSLRQRFDWIVTQVPAWPNSTKPPPGHVNKDELLRVLDRPDIPLHTNGTENAVRSFVTKRRISDDTRSAAGKQARDASLKLLKTCSKLATPFRANL